MAINQLSGGSASLEAKFNAKGDILVATANDNSAAVSVGSNGTILIADSTQSSGVRWGANAPDVATAKGDLITRTTSGYSVLPVGTNGQALLADSTTATGLRWGSSASLPYYYKSQVFTSSGTWTAPTSVQYVDVLAIGGGGGGAAGARNGATNPAMPGGGGAGGSLAYVRNVPVTPGATYTVTVGSGGAGGTGLNVFQSGSNTTQTTGPTGANGGDSAFGTANTIQYVLALGGQGGGTANAGGGYSRQNGMRFAQYTFGTGDSRQGTYWMGIYNNTSNLRLDTEQSMRNRWISQNSTFDDNDSFYYYGPDGAIFYPGGASTSDYSNATTAARMSGNPLGAGWQPSRDWAKDSNQWYRTPGLPLASGNVTPGAPTAGTAGNQTGSSAVQTGIGGGGGRGGLAAITAGACTAGDFGNSGAGSGGGAGFNNNAGNGGNAGANSGAGGGGGGASFGSGTFSSGSGGTGGSGFVVLGWVGA